MNLGIERRNALVCASSQGLGLACATALAREGASVCINGRDERRLQEAASRIESQVGRPVKILCADLTQADSRARVIDACSDVDILVNNNAGPPPGVLEDWDYSALIRAYEQNMVPAALLIRAAIPGMRQRKFGRIVNITSAMVKAPHPLMALSASARAALTAFCKALSHEVAEDNVTINNLLPERIDTDRQRFMAERIMKQEGVDREEARRRIVATISARRFGTPEEFGDACAFLCSAQAGYISGQNLQLDGGSYAGLA